MAIMPTTDLSVPLSLTTICGGELDREFQEMYPRLLAAMGSEDKTGITITVEMKRLPDTSTMISLQYTIKPNFPSRKKVSICQSTSDGKLLAERPAARPRVVPLIQEN